MPVQPAQYWLSKSEEFRRERDTICPLNRMRALPERWKAAIGRGVRGDRERQGTGQINERKQSSVIKAVCFTALAGKAMKFLRDVW